tara:strand:- start:1938 stop:2558 length:621 start_codon:yes stop_codon:yes gene_type:complete
MIGVIDYGAGNLRSVLNAFRALGQTPFVIQKPSELVQASGVVLPGVGAFGKGMEKLKQMGLIEALNEAALVQKKPFLGICLGLQFLASVSREQGEHKGLGWLNGTVEAIVPSSSRHRIPHMGWNNLALERTTPLFEGVSETPTFFFVHSYELVLERDESRFVTSTCDHGTKIISSVQKENIFGVQFHPEKSQADGLCVLKNFVNLI